MVLMIMEARVWCKPGGGSRSAFAPLCWRLNRAAHRFLLVSAEPDEPTDGVPWSTGKAMDNQSKNCKQGISPVALNVQFQLLIE